MRKLRQIILLCLTAGVILSCMAYTFAYNGQTVHSTEAPDTSALSADELEYISNLGTEKYNHLLDVWREDMPYSSAQEEIYPPFYSGCYEDEDKYLVIMVTSLDQEVTDYFGSLIDLEYVRFSLAEDSYQDLRDGQAVINQLLQSGAFGETITDLFTGTGISVQENAVNLYVGTNDIDSIRSIIEEVYAANTDRPCKLRFVSAWIDSVALEPSEPDERNDIQQPYIVNGAVVEPGGPIRIEDLKDPFCVGFWVKDYFGNPGIITASHGLLRTSQRAYASKDGTNDDAYYGYVVDDLYDGAVDAAFIRRADDRFGPITYVDGWNFYLKSETMDVAEGKEIYKRGIVTGATKGIVIDTNFNPSSIPGSKSKLTSVVLTTCYGEIGDSGGIVAGGGSTSSRYVAGIVAGGLLKKDTETNEILETYMFYSRASDICRRLRVTVY